MDHCSWIPGLCHVRVGHRRALGRAVWREKLREQTGKTTVAVVRAAIMPHVSSSGGGDDLGSEDEVKVFKDEGEEEKRSSENLTEEKSDLIDLTESEVRRISFLLGSQPHPAPVRLSLTSRRPWRFAYSRAFLFSSPPYSRVLLDLFRYPQPSPPCRRRELSVCQSRVLQEKGSLAGGSYTTTGKATARSDLSPVFGESCNTPYLILAILPPSPPPSHTSPKLSCSWNVSRGLTHCFALSISLCFVSRCESKYLTRSQTILPRKARENKQIAARYSVNQSAGDSTSRRTREIVSTWSREFNYSAVSLA